MKFIEIKKILSFVLIVGLMSLISCGEEDEKKDDDKDKKSSSLVTTVLELFIKV